MIETSRRSGFVALVASVALLAGLSIGCGTVWTTSGNSLSVSVLPTQNPLVAQFTCNAGQGASVSVEFGTDTTYGRQTSSQSPPAGSGQVVILVAGMKPSTTYHMRALVTYPDNSKDVSLDQTFVTGEVPANRLPITTVARPSGLTPAGGVELLDLASGSATQIRAGVVDLDGNLIWYYDFPITNNEIPFPIKPLSNGHFLITITDLDTTGKGMGGTLREIDLAGNTIREITLAQLNTRLSTAGFNIVGTSMHHDFAVLPNGHVIVLVNDTRAFTNLAGYEGQSVSVMGDDLVDLDENFNPVWVWSTFDHLDVNRHPVIPLPDWTHANAVVYSPDDGNLLLSVRNQSWVMKIDYQNGSGTGELLYRLGYQGDLTIDTGNVADWPYGQHAPIFLGPSSANVFEFALFDNGFYRVLDNNGTTCGISGAPACYSRSVIFQVSEATKIVHIVWEDKPLEYSSAVGDSIQLSNGDMEFDLGILASGTQVDEVTQEAAPQTVWQLNIANQIGYRAFRIPSLYPGVQW